MSGPTNCKYAKLHTVVHIHPREIQLLQDVAEIAPPKPEGVEELLQAVLVGPAIIIPPQPAPKLIWKANPEPAQLNGVQGASDFLYQERLNPRPLQRRMRKKTSMPRTSYTISCRATVLRARLATSFTWASRMTSRRSSTSPDQWCSAGDGTRLTN